MQKQLFQAAPARFSVLLADNFSSIRCKPHSNFSSSVSIADSNETEILTGTSGMIYSHIPGLFPMNYTNNLNKTWVIQLQDGESVELMIGSFKTQLDQDVLRIFAGIPSEIDMEKPLFTFSGDLYNAPKRPIVYTGNLTLMFTTDDSITDQGFSISFMKFKLFTKILKEPRGLIQWPVENLQMPTEDLASIEFRWVIDVKGLVNLKFELMNFTSQLYTIIFYELSNELLPQNQRFYVFDDVTMPKEFFLAGPVVVRLKTVVMEDMPEMKIRYEVVENSEIKMATEILSTADGLRLNRFMNSYDYYYPNVSMAWTILLKETQKLSLHFMKFKTQANMDILSIYNGTDQSVMLNDKPLMQFSGLLDTIEMKSLTFDKNITLVFKTNDDLIVDEGFIFAFTITNKI